MKIRIQTGVEARRLMNRLVLNIPAELLEILDKNMEQFFLAGGVFVSLITGQKITDLDFFFQTPEAAYLAHSLVRQDALFTEGPVTSNCYNFTFAGKKIQFITKAFGLTIDEILGQFDFRAVMIGTNRGGIATRAFYAEENAILDIASRTLTVMAGHRHPFNVSGRIAKYITKKGFTCPPRSFVQLILQQLIRAQSVKTLADVRDEILGLDTLILEQFFKGKEDKWPSGRSIGETELKDLMVDIDQYFTDRLAAAAMGQGMDPESEDGQ